MAIDVNLSPYGACAPRPFDEKIIQLARRLPAGWLGLRCAMVLRRIVMHRLGSGAIDTVVWGRRARLYPRGNGCEKSALFTPQMFDIDERKALSGALERSAASGKPFTFVDIGANVGLYALFVAGHRAGQTRVLAIEPQPGILQRLIFNIEANPDLQIDVAPFAVVDREGEIELVIDHRDRGGTHVSTAAAPAGAEVVRVRCRPLAAILADFDIRTIDALKIDIEGAEDLALAPFLRVASPALLPRLLLVEDRPGDWKTDIFRLLEERGYRLLARTRQNVLFRLV